MCSYTCWIKPNSHIPAIDTISFHHFMSHIASRHTQHSLSTKAHWRLSTTLGLASCTQYIYSMSILSSPPPMVSSTDKKVISFSGHGVSQLFLVSNGRGSFSCLARHSVSPLGHGHCHRRGAIIVIPRNTFLPPKAMIGINFMGCIVIGWQSRTLQQRGGFLDSHGCDESIPPRRNSCIVVLSRGMSPIEVGLTTPFTTNPGIIPIRIGLPGGNVMFQIKGLTVGGAVGSGGTQVRGRSVW